MGAIHWSQSPKLFCTFPPTSYEWEMKNFSFLNLPQNPNPNPQLIQLKEKDKQNSAHHGVDESVVQRPICDWDINLAAVISSSTNQTSSSDTLGVIEFDPSDSFIATGGIARKIRSYNLNSLLPDEGSVALLDHATASDFCICTPAKLSSLRWKPGSASRVLGSADYDGVVMEYDLERKIPVFERDEHGGRRVWSLDYSPMDPVLGASASDDGTMQIWDTRCDGGDCVAAVQPSVVRSPVCCVEFNPFGSALVAVGCADRKAYGYDIRKISEPVMVFDGHSKTVTYVRFLDRHTVLSASTDGCLKQWNIDDNNSLAIRTYEGHVNSRSFVGLSIWRNGGLIGCGSEDNRVFVYDKRWGEPIWVRDFNRMDPVGSGRGLVSSVCWRQLGEERCTLVAGGSDGVLQVFVGERRSL